MKKWLFLFMVVSLSLSGCWDRVEVDEIAIVMGIGIDRVPHEKEPILLSIQIVNAAAQKKGGTGSGQGPPLYVITSQGKTLFSAVQKFNSSYPRRFNFSHNKIVVFGKDFARTDIVEALDYINRDREFRENMWVAVVDKTAKEVLQMEFPLEPLSGKALNSMMSKFMENAFTPPIEFYKFRNLMKAETKTCTTPLIRIEEREKKVDSMLEESTGKKIEKSKFGLEKVVVIEDTAVFHENKMVGKLNKNESRGLLWLKNQLTGGEIVIPKDGNDLSIYIPEGKTKITPSVKGNQILMKIECEADAAIKEVELVGLDLKDPKVIKQLEKQAADILKNRVKHTIEKAQKDIKVDFIGFGSTLHNDLPDEWKRFKKDWPEIFPQVKYEIHFQVNINTSGKITKE